MLAWILVALQSFETGFWAGQVGYRRRQRMGTIMIIAVYFVALLSLPRFYLRYFRDRFNVVKHLVIPVLGMAAIAFPMWQLIKPGQPSPYSWFPYFTLAVIIVGTIYALVMNARDKTLGDRVGSIVADE